jgi:hypothetical protein
VTKMVLAFAAAITCSLAGATAAPAQTDSNAPVPSGTASQRSVEHTGSPRDNAPPGLIKGAYIDQGSNSYQHSKSTSSSDRVTKIFAKYGLALVACLVLIVLAIAATLLSNRNRSS